MVDLLETPEQEQIVAAVDDFLRGKLPLDRLRTNTKRPPTGDVALWREMAELGWFGLGLPEARGGIGYTVTEEMLVFRQLGRHVTTPAVLAGVLGARVAAAAGKADLAASILSGAVRPAIANPHGPVEIGATVSGQFHLFEDYDAPLVLVWDDKHAALLERSAIASAKTLPPLDDRLSLQLVTLKGTAVAVTSEPVHRQASILIAAMLTGVAEAARDAAVEYAKIREQFGQKIGAFQAIKHRCSDMAVKAEAALSQTVFAAISEAGGKSDAAFQAAAARIAAADAGVFNSVNAIQIHGGIGFTADCEAHRFLKRAHVLARLGGTVRQHKAALLEASLAA